MGILNGGLAGIFGAAFGPIYLDGYMRFSHKTFDAYGTPTEAFVSMAVKVQVDGVTEAMRAESGFTEKDARLIILQRNGLGETVPEPTADCRVKIGARPPSASEWRQQAWQIGSVSSDPGNTYWEARATPST